MRVAQAFRCRNSRRFRMYSPGSTVAVRIGFVNHVGIVSDRLGDDGCPQVISNSKRRRCVVEETWSSFADGRTVALQEHHAGIEGRLRVQRARRLIGARWNLLSFNCEHLVEYAAGREPR